MGNILAHIFLFFLQGIKSESGHVMILNLLDLFGAITMTSLDDVKGRLTAPPVFSKVLGFVCTCSLYRYPQLHCMFADLNLSIFVLFDKPWLGYPVFRHNNVDGRVIIWYPAKDAFVDNYMCCFCRVSKALKLANFRLSNHAGEISPYPFDQ
jgi:hypothetical protein